ncbi:MAG: hypothetical protein LUG52_02640 [Clostridia bacterium]|nr:hypothetical protein [Clostridia bacterium]
MRKSLWLVWIICALLLVLLAVLMFTEQKSKNEKTTQIESVNRNSALYENRLAALEAELEEKRAALESFEENGFVCVAAKVSSASELDTVSSWLDEYDYPLTVIIDTDLSSSSISPILSEMRSLDIQSVMYCGSTYDWAENTEDTDLLLSRSNLSQCGIAYFDYAASYSQISAAQSTGMRGYSSPFTSADDFNTDMNDDDISSIGHVLISSDTSSEIDDIAATAAEECKIFILAIDMTELDTSFTANSAKQALKTIDAYVEEGTLQVVSMDEYLEHFDEGYDERQAAKAEFEAYEKEALAEIAEIEAALDEMYAIIE